MSLLDGGEGDSAPAPPPTLARARRRIGLTCAASLAVFAWGFAALGALHGWSAIESPYLALSVAAFWAAAYCVVYLYELSGIERTLRRAGALDVTGVRVFWLRDPRTGGLGATMEVRARFPPGDFPEEVAVFLNVDVFWYVHVVGLRASWSCKESGVLLLTPLRPRFLGGATAESVGLPSQEGAALRGLLREPGEPEGLPDWGAPVGERGKLAIEASGVGAWLYGPEQPFVAFAAFEGVIEKFWSPLSTRIVDLDVPGTLDLLRVVRAFDLDALAARGGPLTSSRSSPPSSRRP